MRCREGPMMDLDWKVKSSRPWVEIAELAINGWQYFTLPSRIYFWLVGIRGIEVF